MMIAASDSARFRWRDALHGDDGRWVVIFLMVVAAIQIPILFLGPGPDIDSTRVLNITVSNLLTEGRYVPSRFTGNPTHEFMSAALFWVGGVPLCNAGTLVMSLLALVAFIVYCRMHFIPNWKWLAVCLAFHPIYFCNSACVIDYLWAMCLLLWGLILLERNANVLSGILFGLAIGARLAISPVAGVLVVWITLIDRKRPLSACLCLLAMGVVATLMYLPAFFYAGKTLAFLDYSIGSWTWFGHFVRFVVRNAYFWSIAGAIMLLLLLPVLASGIREGLRSRHRNVTITALVAIFACELLYLKVPLDMGYLLPILPFALILVGIGLQRRRMLLIGFTLILLSYHVWNVLLIQPDRPDNAQSASMTFRLQRGYTFSYFAERLGKKVPMYFR